MIIFHLLYIFLNLIRNSREILESLNANCGDDFLFILVFLRIFLRSDKEIWNLGIMIWEAAFHYFFLFIFRKDYNIDFYIYN